MEHRTDNELRKHWEANREIAFTFPTRKAYIQNYRNRQRQEYLNRAALNGDEPGSPPVATRKGNYHN